MKRAAGRVGGGWRSDKAERQITGVCGFGQRDIILKGEKNNNNNSRQEATGEEGLIKTPLNWGWGCPGSSFTF